MPILTSAASTVAASCGRASPALMPIQKTRGDFGLGKKPTSWNLIANGTACTVERAFLISCTRTSLASPMNFNVTCSDSGRAQRASGARLRTRSRYSVMLWRMLLAISRAMKTRMVHMSLRRTMSSACCVAQCRMRSRSPGNLRSCTEVWSPSESAT